MKKIVAISLCFFSLFSEAKEEGPLDEGLVNPGFVEKPEWFKQSFLDLRDDVQEAADEGRRVMLYFFQDGCPYCKKLIGVNFSQQDVVKKTREKFDVIAINMWGDREVTDMSGRSVTEKQFASHRRVMFTPTILFLDEKGKKVLRINGYYHPGKFMAALDYASDKKAGQTPFREYLAKNKTSKSSGKLNKQPFFVKTKGDLSTLAGKKGKPLLVLFEQKDCKACDELHQDIFRRKESLSLLDQFHVVQFDMWSKGKIRTPKGIQMNLPEWINQLDIKYSPTAVFFDQKGKEVFRMEAYLKSFHVQSSLDYVASAAYKKEPSFQRYIDVRADGLRDQGIEINLMQ